MSESNGVWGVANEVPNFDGDAPVDGAFECTLTVGNLCSGWQLFSRGGGYHRKPFLTPRDNGVTWGSPSVDVPGVEALNLRAIRRPSPRSPASKPRIMYGRRRVLDTGPRRGGFRHERIERCLEKGAHHQEFAWCISCHCAVVQLCEQLCGGRQCIRYGTAELDLEVNGAWRPFM